MFLYSSAILERPDDPGSCSEAFGKYATLPLKSSGILEETRLEDISNAVCCKVAWSVVQVREMEDCATPPSGMSCVGPGRKRYVSDIPETFRMFFAILLEAYSSLEGRCLWVCDPSARLFMKQFLGIRSSFSSSLLCFRL
jgi:hypothetical protein